MAEGQGGEKTEEPTSKKREDARKEGNVPKSQEVGHVIVLLAGIIFLRLYIPTIGRLYTKSLTYFCTVLTPESLKNAGDVSFVQNLFVRAMMTFFQAALPVSLMILFWGVVSNLLQVGFLFTTKPLEPKFSKINPISGFSKFFSVRSLVETIKNLLKLAIVAYIAYSTVRGEYSKVLSACNESVLAICVAMLLLSYKVAIRIVLTLVVIAILDLIYQRYDNTQKLKMSKQEVKEEHKQQEGDPQVKARIRQLQREMASRRMLQEVPEATVVITNPTHLSIAIKYEENMPAPLVVAKGADHMAMKIREVATENDIPLVEDVPLARGMYDQVEPGDEVPVEFFNAVAEVLAYVYRVQGKI